MDITKAKEYITRRLKEENNLDHYYHDLEHTLDVWRSAVRICRMEGISKHDQLLVETAALYHDIGMLTSYIGHEAASVVIAKESLPGFGYSDDDIECISKMILTTRLPQSAREHNEMILCDADLDYLGREDFFMIAHRLRLEWDVLHIKSTRLAEWYKLQISFMEDHQFFTSSARILRDEGKAFNLNQIKDLFNHQ